MLEELQIGQFVKVSSGRIGTVVGHYTLGHYHVWFGDIRGRRPFVERLEVHHNWELVNHTWGGW